MNPLHEGLNNSHTTAALFVDISKAFDMVDHQILLDKLWHIGFRGCLYEWLKSFLEGRSQRVSISGCLSRTVKLNVGVPQGSVLGPILFLVYVNSIFRQKFNGKVVAFADDMAFAYDCCNYSTAVSCSNKDLEILSEWFAVHKLVLSAKTKAVLFNLSMSNRSFNRDIIFHDVSCSRSSSCTVYCMVIESVSSIKYLGLNVDCHLDWKCHIAALKSSLHSSIRMLYLLRSHCPFGFLKNYYHALIDSRLRYGICCWGGTYYETIKPLIIAQKHAIRLMFFKNKRFHSWPLFVTCSILPLKHLYVFKVMKIYFVISGNRNLSCHYDLRRNTMCLKIIPKFYKTHFLNYFLVTAPRIFNKLPKFIRESNSKNTFVTSLKTWLLHNESLDFLFNLIV